jgi:cobalt-zinc-cadmium resistance protein CzcA
LAPPPAKPARLGNIFSIPLSIFDRNQGEIARTQFAIIQAQENQAVASEGVLTDVVNAYENLRTTGEVVNLYTALMGVSVETAVILVSYINKLRLERMDIRQATREASLLRLRPIRMTALVACLGLLPAALSTGVGSDTQKPFAIAIVAGLISRLLLGFFVNPVLYEMVAREGDVLQV